MDTLAEGVLTRLPKQKWGYPVAQPNAFPIRRLQPDDAQALATFYNGLGPESKRLFHPICEQTTVAACQDIAKKNAGDGATNYDIIMVDQDCVVGWGFLWKIKEPKPNLGIGIADQYQGKRHGTALMDAVMNVARKLDLKHIHLIVVVENEKAKRLYENNGFEVTNKFQHPNDGLMYYGMDWCPPGGGRRT